MSLCPCSCLQVQLGQLAAQAWQLWYVPVNGLLISLAHPNCSRAQAPCWAKMPTSPKTIQEEAGSILAAWQTANVQELSLAAFVTRSEELARGDLVVTRRHVRDNSRVVLAAVVGMPDKALPPHGRERWR